MRSAHGWAVPPECLRPIAYLLLKIVDIRYGMVSIVLFRKRIAVPT